jgi:hypothetical protein
MTLEAASYPRHRFPAEIIRHAVWLYHVFSLSLHDVTMRRALSRLGQACIPRFQCPPDRRRSWEKTVALCHPAGS